MAKNGAIAFGRSLQHCSCLFCSHIFKCHIIFGMVRIFFAYHTISLNKNGSIVHCEQKLLGEMFLANEKVKSSQTMIFFVWWRVWEAFLTRAITRKRTKNKNICIRIIFSSFTALCSFFGQLSATHNSIASSLELFFAIFKTLLLAYSWKEFFCSSWRVFIGRHSNEYMGNCR